MGEGYAHLVSFAAEPEISASSFDINSDSSADISMDVLKLPLYREYAFKDSDWRWFVQGAFSSFTYTEELAPFEIIPTVSTGVEGEWKAYSGVAEAGLIMPVGDTLSIAGSLGAGGTRLKNISSISNPLVADALAPLLEGTVINWRSSAVIGRAHLGLLYREQWNRLKVRASTHMVYSYVESFNESTDFPGFTAYTGSLSAKLDVAQPLDIVLNEHPLYLIGHAAATTFTGPGRDQLGFTHFYELGASLGYRQVALGLQAVLGPDVDGLSITFNYGF
ncbi:hypothetical protein [Parahaliea mediterranea]|uniref:hypothetical protein n=1 Tax=Parahaliea mediterranea TaxID=651086 RepID=UPI000E2E8378|nr:hypothetical protein [Parahaliea mediterranea]